MPQLVAHGVGLPLGEPGAFKVDRPAGVRYERQCQDCGNSPRLLDGHMKASNAKRSPGRRKSSTSGDAPTGALAVDEPTEALARFEQAEDAASERIRQAIRDAAAGLDEWYQSRTTA